MAGGSVAGPPPRGPIDLILFDLDGTLLDTAPDLARALNRLLIEQGRPELPLMRIRPVVSNGSPGLLGLGFGIDRHAPTFDALRSRLLTLYREDLAAETTLFAGMDAVLADLEARGLRWGVVTNKPGWLTDPLMEAVGLSGRAACVVSGDTVAQRKPDPAPLLHACRCVGERPERAVYVGDAPRDIEAARNAGMHSLVATYGYLDGDTDPNSWRADALIARPIDLLAWLDARMDSAADA